MNFLNKTVELRHHFQTLLYWNQTSNILENNSFVAIMNLNVSIYKHVYAAILSIHPLELSCGWVFAAYLGQVWLILKPFSSVFQLHVNTKQDGWCSSAFNLYSGGAHFKTWSGHQLSWWTFFCVYSVFPDMYQDSNTVRSWLLPSASFPIHCSVLSYHLLLRSQTLTWLK